jgi:hypothetical protein
MKKLIVMALAASTAGLFAVPAQAETVTFNGNRPVECSVTGYDSVVNFNTLGRNGETSTYTDGGVGLFCNQPFHASVKSENGYLKLVTANDANDSVSETNLTSNANPQFAAGINYGLDFGGNIGVVGSQYAFANVDYNLGNHAAANITGQTVNYDTINSALPLLGGLYTDTVTLTLTPLGV